MILEEKFYLSLRLISTIQADQNATANLMNLEFS